MPWVAEAPSTVAAISVSVRLAQSSDVSGPPAVSHELCHPRGRETSRTRDPRSRLPAARAALEIRTAASWACKRNSAPTMLARARPRQLSLTRSSLRRSPRVLRGATVGALRRITQTFPLQGEDALSPASRTVAGAHTSSLPRHHPRPSQAFPWGWLASGAWPTCRYRDSAPWPSGGSERPWLTFQPALLPTFS